MAARLPEQKGAVDLLDRDGQVLQRMVTYLAEKYRLKSTTYA